MTPWTRTGLAALTIGYLLILLTAPWWATTVALVAAAMCGWKAEHAPAPEGQRP